MSRSANTERAYRADWRAFEGWCLASGIAPQPATPATVVAYVEAHTGELRPSTLERRLAAIAWMHREAQLPAPTTDARVRQLLTRIRWRQRHRRAPVQALDVDGLRALVAGLGDSRADRRDRALVLLSYGAALRSSELVALDLDDVVERADGLRVRLARGNVFVPAGSTPDVCAVRAWRAWVACAGEQTGAAFRPIDRHDCIGDCRVGDRAVREIVKRLAARAGLDASRYSPLSLRLGMVSTAAAVGVSDEVIMAQTGLRSRALVRRYARNGRDGRA